MDNSIYKERFAVVFKAQYPRMYYYALQLLKDEDASRDIVSETFAHVWEHFASFEQASLPSWLMATVRNKCLDHLRHAQVEMQYADYYLHAVDECCADTDENAERMKQVAQMLSLLPPTTRHVLEECYLNHKKYKDVAQEMNVCQETVKRHIMKALKMLREHYKSNKN